MKHSVEEVVLSTGARGLLIDVPEATVMSTLISFRAGIHYAKSPRVYEIAHVMEHLSFGANAKYRDEQKYEAEFIKNGAYHNAWTGDTLICYETECADFEWDRILELKRVAIAQPRFNNAELQSEKGNVRTELTSYMNEYPRLLWPRLQRELGEDTPSLQERLKTVNNIELRDIREHYHRTHTARNMRFVIAGKLRRRKRQIIDMLESWELEEGERLPLPKYELHAAPAVSIRRKDAANISFGFSWVTPRELESEELAAMSCLDHILTGTMNSRIFGAARKAGLAYNVDCSRTTSLFSSSWDFGGKVNAENAEALFDLIREQLTQVLNGKLEESELEAAKTYSYGRHQMGAQTVAQIAEIYGNDYFTLDRIFNYEDDLNLIRKIEISDMVALAREFVDANISALVTVSSEKKELIDNLAAKLQL